MGLMDSIIAGRQKVINTLDKAAGIGSKAESTPTSFPAKTPEQAAYEAKTDQMNAKNPYYKVGDAVPRAKGGRVKAGGAPMKNVNSRVTKMKMGCK